MGSIEDNPAGIATPQDVATAAQDEQAGGALALDNPAITADRSAKIREDALHFSAEWKLCEDQVSISALLQECKKTDREISSLSQSRAKAQPLSSRYSIARRHVRLLRAASRDASNALRAARKLPAVTSAQEPKRKMPRSYQAAVAFLESVDFVFRENEFIFFMDACQKNVPWEMWELKILDSMMQLAVLQAFFPVISIAAQPRQHDRWEQLDPTILIRCLEAIRRVNFSEAFDQLSQTEAILRQDPLEVYPLMDLVTRDLYRETLRELATHSDEDEFTVAQIAVDLARAASRPPENQTTAVERKMHVGYYLLREGRRELERRINYHVPFWFQFREAVRSGPDMFYVISIEFVTFALVAFALSGLDVGIPLISSILLLLFPASQAAIEFVNLWMTTVVSPQPLPKIDFSRGISSQCTTIVAVPTLLISKKQVSDLVLDLEVRYLGNRDAHLHFALLTDFPDSRDEVDGREDLVELCSSLIRDLNNRYAAAGKGQFFLFHRNRVYNEAEGAWMGWERKRGKLMDFNSLLLGKRDSFPVKIGDLAVLSTVKYVITLDSDTQLPRESAHKLVGAMAHPLNRAILDSATNTVVQGYGVLQPRVGISVHSARGSRLAAIYSGQTGLDIYSRAVSDVYQDLFGEGIFTGKGIYEVAVFEQVLEHRFPTNAILSHDLIEGAYARAGLLSDVEVIDDYPSHFSAYSRRKHRWIRGDWQIMRWLFSRVPNAAGQLVANPLSLISRWKILDNLRRSTVEAGTFFLFLSAWLFFPGSPWYWTGAILGILLMPAYFQLLLSIVILPLTRNLFNHFGQITARFLAGQVNVLMFLMFLPHQALLTLDAVLRAVIRMTITRRKLLEWETAAQSEIDSRKRTPVDIYLLWTPAICFLLTILIALFRRHALPAALPMLGLWTVSQPLVRWLDRPLQRKRPAVPPEDSEFLRRIALKTWRFFRVYSNTENNWLIPDHVTESTAEVAFVLSPTNLGLLFDSTFSAHQLGFIGLVEFVQRVDQTMAHTLRLARTRGHFLNWYDTRSLAALQPRFVSTVDSGNLACSLVALRQACLFLRAQPVLGPSVAHGLRDYCKVLEAFCLDPVTLAIAQSMSDKLSSASSTPDACLEALSFCERELPKFRAAMATSTENVSKELAWWMEELNTQLAVIRHLIENFFPWADPQFAQLSEILQLRTALEYGADLTLLSVPKIVAKLTDQIKDLKVNAGFSETVRASAGQLEARLPNCVVFANDCLERLEKVARRAEALVNEMDFTFLYNTKRKALSVGFNVETGKLEESCYDLLASEARSAVFIAIAKGDIPQETWIRLGRSLTKFAGKHVLLSWTGTMFEYLMPSLWIRSYSGTLLESSACGAVRCQQAATRHLEIPWGISESSYLLEEGSKTFGYKAFGVNSLALKADTSSRLVIAPYAAFLACCVDSPQAIGNLRAMEEKKWVGPHGFYESFDFGEASSANKSNFATIDCWMAHHQGMCLVSICNLLAKSIHQELFHTEPMIVATEALLHEQDPVFVEVETLETAN